MMIEDRKNVARRYIPNEINIYIFFLKFVYILSSCIYKIKKMAKQIIGNL